MKIECPRCHKKSEFALSGKDILFTTQYCDSCKKPYTRVLRNIKIEEGTLLFISGEVTELNEEKQEGGKGHGKEKE